MNCPVCGICTQWMQMCGSHASGLGPAAWKGPALSLPGEMTSDHSRAVGFQFPGSLYNSPASSLCAFNEKLGCGGVVSTAIQLLSA